MIGQQNGDRKALGGERGMGSAQDGNRTRVAAVQLRYLSLTTSYELLTTRLSALTKDTFNKWQR